MATVLSRFGMAAFFAVGMGFAFANSAGAVTIDSGSDFFADDPLVCVVGGNYDCVSTAISF